MVPPTSELLLQLALIIVVAKVAGNLAVRVGLSAVLGEILAGVVLGPSLFGLQLNNEVILFLADIGVILLLLEVGLATDPQEIRRVGVRALLVASLGVGASFLLGTLGMVALGRPFLAALLMGAALAATSLGITARVLADLGKVESPEGRTVIAAALFDDIMGLVLLSILIGIALRGSVDVLGILFIVILSLLFIGLPLILGQALGRSLVRVAERGRGRGVLTTTAFVAALVLAVLAQAIGLALILGGFAAGLILSSTEKKAHLQERIRPLADLFVPVFFVLVGSLADLRTLGQPGVALLAVVLLAAAVVGKLAAGLGSLKSLARPLRVGASMIPRGEVALIVASFAAFRLQPALWDQPLYSALLVVVLLTTLITPPLVRFTFREEGARAAGHMEATFPPGENVPFEEAPGEAGDRTEPAEADSRNK